MIRIRFIFVLQIDKGGVIIVIVIIDRRQLKENNVKRP